MVSFFFVQKVNTVIRLHWQIFGQVFWYYEIEFLVLLYKGKNQGGPWGPPCC